MTAFAFGVPLSSRKTATDWDRTVRLFKAAMWSILRQSDKDFKVFVACHEVPNIPELADDRVQVLRADWEPSRGADMMDDRAKHELVAAQWRAAGGGYLMFVDADLVSRNIVAYARTHNEVARGFFGATGWEYDAGTGKISYTPRFHKCCGSSIIINWRIGDLPQSKEDGCLYTHVLNGGHARTVEFFEGRGEPLSPLPFPVAVYVRNHGDNVSVPLKSDGWRRNLVRAVMPKRNPSDEQMWEFGL
jgi:hypothetical protein